MIAGAEVRSQVSILNLLLPLACPGSLLQAPGLVCCGALLLGCGCFGPFGSFASFGQAHFLALHHGDGFALVQGRPICAFFFARVRAPCVPRGTSHRDELANGQSSCEGSQAPHGSDRRFLRDECQSFSSHGVRVTLDLHLSLPIPSGLGVIGGVGSLSTGSPSGRGSGYLGLMRSQAPVRSYTKDRAGLQGDHTPKGGGYKVKNRNSSCGNLCRPHWTQVVAYHCLSVLCGGKGTAPGCAPRGSPKAPSEIEHMEAQTCHKLTQCAPLPS